ncbi:MAG: hypothetical protein AB7C98_05910 [Acidithiobacillus sp.]
MRLKTKALPRCEAVLEQRVEQDANRDALDAVKDAETLVRALTYVAQILFDPTTRYVLRDRIRTDLGQSDLAGALDDAHRLLRQNQVRLNTLHHRHGGANAR